MFQLSEVIYFEQVHKVHAVVVHGLDEVGKIVLLVPVLHGMVDLGHQAQLQIIHEVHR